MFPLQVRVKIMAKLSEETKGPLMKLHSCLNGKVSPAPFHFRFLSRDITGRSFSSSALSSSRPSRTS